MDENVKFVPKEINSPNINQARPIENYWVCLAQKVFEGDLEAETEQQLIRGIESKMKEFVTNFVESLLEGSTQIILHSLGIFRKSCFHQLKPLFWKSIVSFVLLLNAHGIFYKNNHDTQLYVLCSAIKKNFLNHQKYRKDTFQILYKNPPQNEYVID